MNQDHKLYYLKVSEIEPHPNNPRGEIDPASVAELTASVKEKGIVEPLLVVPKRSSGKQWDVIGHTVIAGHRRRLAAIQAGLETVPAIVREGLSEAEQEDIMLTENIQREDLTLLQEARAYRRRLDIEGITQADLARRLGVPPHRITERLHILKLPVSIQPLFDGLMPVTAAPLLVKIENPDRQIRLANMVANRGLSVPALKEMVEKEKAVKQSEGSSPKLPRKIDSGSQKKTTPEFTRVDAVRALEGLSDDTLTYADVLASLDGVCTSCGMKSSPAICGACPLPQMINNLVNQQRYAKAA